MRSFIILVASLSASLLSTTVGAATPQDGVPNFAPGPGLGWRTDAPTYLAALRGFGVQFFPSPPTEPQPVKADPKVFNKDHPFDPSTTWPVVDLTNPNLQPRIVDVLRAQNQRVLSGGQLEQRLCWPSGLPMTLATVATSTFFVQSANEVVILNQQYRQVRRVALNRAHSPNPKLSWFGESIGHYENGDTLVIDTIGLNDRTLLDPFNTPHTTALHVIERWRLSVNGQDMDLRVRVEDPGAFKAPYEMTQRLHRVQDPWLEYACGENPNDPLLGGLLPIPLANKPDF